MGFNSAFKELKKYNR